MEADDLPGGQAARPRDRRVDARVVSVGADDRLEDVRRHAGAVRVDVHHRAADVAHRHRDRRRLVVVAERDDAADPGVLIERDADVRRFRPNVLVRSAGGVPFEEDAWVGGVLTFGDEDEPPAVAVTMRDVRCAMVSIDPDGAGMSPDVLKAVVRANGNNAGIYATVTRSGRLAVGQIVRLHR